MQGNTEAVIDDRSAAEARWRSDPFHVEGADLELLDLDVVFFLPPDASALRARPRYRSKARKLLEKIPGVHYLKTEKAYFFPTAVLNDFLKQLRDKQLSFAVEAAAGRRLKGGAEIRARLKENPKSGTEEELREALLVPYLHAEAGDDGEVRFALRGYTTQQLRESFPEAESYSDRRALAAGFDTELLGALFSRLAKSGTHVWQTADAAWHIGNVPASWVRSGGSRAGLLLSQEFYNEHFAPLKKNNPFKKLRREILPGDEEKFFFPVRSALISEFRREVDEFLETKGMKAVSASRGFEKFLKEIAGRDVLRRDCLAYQARTDTAFEAGTFSDSELSGKLFPHQRVAVSWLLSRRRAFLGDDMGLGKTLSVLAAFDALKQRGEVDFLLVICPNSLVRNWVRETERWIGGRRLIRLPEDKRGKVMTFKQLGWGGLSGDGLVLNYESARLDYVAEDLEKLLSKRRTLLCLDESQRVKSPQAKSFQVLRALAPYCDRRILLSGTPTPRDIADIWAQVLLLDDGERFGTNFYEWLASVAELGNRYSDFAVKRYLPEETAETISRVQELLLRRRKEEVVQLPEKTFSIRDVELKGDQLARYEQVRKDLLLRMTTVSGHTFIREIDNILEEYLRAVQMASNPRLVDPAWKGTPAKFEELDGILEEIIGERDEKAVVWTNYLGNVRELVERYKGYGAAAFSGEVSTAERDRIVSEFQTGKAIRLLVAVPAAGGVGITLTAAQTAVYLDKTWNAEHWLQSVDRLHRIGQTGTVRIISLHACLVDELIARNLARKARQQAELLGDNATDSNRTELDVPSREELLAAVSPEK